MDEELDIALQAAHKAGSIMRQHLGGDIEIQRKTGYKDIVTEIDTACQESIINTIRASFPDAAFLAEENNVEPETTDRYWVIDPIDGTTNYAHTYPSYCTSIALKEDGQSRLGVIHDPHQGETFHAVRGKGAYLDQDTRLTVTDTEQLRDALVITHVSDRYEGMQDNLIGFIQDITNDQATIRVTGSAALNLAYIAAGRADATAIVGIHEWDIAAGELILDEAGGETRTLGSDHAGDLHLTASNGHLQTTVDRAFDRHLP